MLFPEHSKGGLFRVIYQTGSIKVSEMHKGSVLRALSRIDGRAESHGAVSERRDQTGGRAALSEQSLSAVTSVICPHERNCTGHCVLGRKGEPVQF